MKSIEARLTLLERQGKGNPNLVNQWEDMLTRLYHGTAKYDAEHADDPAKRGGALPLDRETIREHAEWFAASGSPATISDLFRLIENASIPLPNEQ